MAGYQYRIRIPKWARHHYEGKSRLRERYDKPEDGEAWLKKIEHQLAMLKAGADKERAGIPTPGKEISLQDAAEGWLRSLRCRARTITSYKWTLVPVYRLDGGYPVSRWSLAHWDHYVAARKREGATNDALIRERQVIQATCKWAAARGYEVHAQVFAIPRPKSAPKVVRRFDPKKTMDAIAKLDGRNRVIAELAAGTGMRSGEMRAARVEWIRWDSSLIEIPHSREYSPKGGRPRVLPMSKRLAKVLRSWVGDRE